MTTREAADKVRAAIAALDEVPDDVEGQPVWGRHQARELLGHVLADLENTTRPESADKPS